MKAMLLNSVVDLSEESEPLRLDDIPVPEPDFGEILIRVAACGVCHTELDEIEGRTPPPKYPVVPGHQAVGIIESLGKGVRRFRKGDRVGVAWIHSACGQCQHCQNSQENLCMEFQATGRDVNGGYAEYMTISAAFAHPVPDVLTDEETAPLLCAGAIGYRSLQLTGIKDGNNLGLTGFGASGHLVLRLVRHLYPNSSVYIFARNPDEREFALENGAVWAGETEEPSPEKLRAVIDTTPAWKPVVEALNNLEPGGRLIINAIRKEEIDKEYLLKINYPEQLWMEKEIKSVANVTRSDVTGMLACAVDFGIKPDIKLYPLREANKALMELKAGGIKGAKVLSI